MIAVLGPFLLATALQTPAADIHPGPWAPRGYACPYANSPVRVDGRLDDAAWSSAPWTDPFVDIEGDRKPRPRHLTRARMLWDDTYFYVGAELEEPHLWATLRERDSVIYYDNDFEVFIDPDGDSHLYTEIELNALDTVWDLLLVRPYRDGGPAIHAWDIPGLRTAVHLDGTLNDARDTDRGWSVEIAIPWAVLRETTRAACPPKEGDRWRVNFSRVQWQLEVEGRGYRKRVDATTGAALPEDNWVWSPQREIAMHEPEHWGIVEFHRENAATTVEPDAMDVVAWHLRWSGYHLAALRESTGAFPDTWTAPELPPSAPVLDPAWNPALVYVHDGERFCLRMTRRDGLATVSLYEDGRLVREP